jgi:hypothetical protein
MKRVILFIVFQFLTSSCVGPVASVGTMGWTMNVLAKDIENTS